MDQHKEEYGLNRCLEAIDLPKSIYYYRKNRSEGPSEEEQELMDHIREIIQEHPDYGYRRILPDLEERAGRVVNHKRLKRLLNEHELGLPRQVSMQNRSPVQEILGDATGQLSLVAGLDPGNPGFPGPLEAFSTDFTELSYAGGNRKAYLMAVVDLESKYVPGWTVGSSANRKLALRCLKQVRERMESLGKDLDEKIIHHDLDSVYTSYRWLRATLLEDGLRVSYSDNGAKGIQGDPRSPGSSRSGDERRTRSVRGSPKPRPYQRCEASSKSASGTTTGSDGTPRSVMFRPENISGRLSNQNLKSLLCLSRN